MLQLSQTRWSGCNIVSKAVPTLFAGFGRVDPCRDVAHYYVWSTTVLLIVAMGAVVVLVDKSERRMEDTSYTRTHTQVREAHRLGQSSRFLLGGRTAQ